MRSVIGGSGDRARMPSRPVGLWARAATREGLPECRWRRCPGGAHSRSGPGQSGRIAILITRPPPSAGFNMALEIRCTPSMSALHVAVCPGYRSLTGHRSLKERGRVKTLVTSSWGCLRPRGTHRNRRRGQGSGGARSRGGRRALRSAPGSTNNMGGGDRQGDVSSL